MFNLLTSKTLRIFNKHKNTIEQINHLAKTMQSWDDTQIQTQTNQLKKRIAGGETLDNLLIEAFATIKEACRRVLSLNLFDVQLLGGIILHQGNITEMKTGEGKTLVATLPAYLNALTTNGVHIVTVNDYLAKRDSEWVGQIFKFLNLSTGLIQQKMKPEERKVNYAMDITYVTNSELGFDYLRDNMAIDKRDIVQKKFNYCIIDEVDSILIDEARTPLIISGPSQMRTDKYIISAQISQKLVLQQHYEIDEKARNIILTEEGISFCETHLNINNIYQVQNPWAQYVLNALKAKELFLKDRHYIAKDQEIIIVDEFTGRIMPGRRWSDGLHQAVEAKENVPIQSENQTLASITYQNFFLLYNKLSGMTGTAITESQEFEKIYKINVIEIPTNKICIRKDLPDLVYKREYDKWIAIANECCDMYQMGRPTLIGTTNVEKSELLAKMLDEYNIPYNLLNAKPKNIEREAEIIAQAGRSHTITIATNMAGRGTDIILGGNPQQIAKLSLMQNLQNYFSGKKDITHIKNNNIVEIQPILKNLYHILDNDLSFKKYDSDQLLKYIDSSIYQFNSTNESIQAIKKAYSHLYKLYADSFANNRKEVLILGGLHVIGTERHESRRIDNQLRGRAGRQGDPGSSRFFLSLEDNLLRIFGGEKILTLMETLNINDDTPIESNILSNSLNNAQKKVESYYYDIRKQLFEYDEVLNNQRQAIYAERNRILHSNYIRDCIIEYGENTIDEIVTFYSEKLKEDINKNENQIEINHKITTILNFSPEVIDNLFQTMNSEQIRYFLYEQLRVTYDLREAYLEQLRPGLVRQLEKYYLLQQIDKAWQEHLEKMANLRESIGWRSYGQQDPLTEYKNEAFLLFIEMITYIRETVIYLVMRSRLVIDPQKIIN